MLLFRLTESYAGNSEIMQQFLSMSYYLIFQIFFVRRMARDASEHKISIFTTDKMIGIFHQRNVITSIVYRQIAAEITDDLCRFCVLSLNREVGDVR